MIKKECLLCGTQEHEVIFSNPKEIISCRGCNLVSVNPFPSDSEIEFFYSREDLLSSTEVSAWFKHPFSKLEKMWRKRLEDIERFKKTGRLLDVGSGMGDFLYLAKKSGWEIFGTEVSAPQVNFAREKFQIDVFLGSLYAANHPNNFFDVIHICHVLEHIAEPLDTLREVYRILKEDGICVIEVPNADFFLRKSYKVSFDKLQHLYHFSANTLERLAKKAGFKIREVKPGDIGNLSQNILIRLSKTTVYYFTQIYFRLFNRNIGENLKIICCK